MHEILFRGKRFDNGKWVEGYVGTAFTMDENRKIKLRHFTALDCLGCSSQVIVLDETIGQYTGLTDKNGVRIFEGDIVTGWFNHEKIVGYIFYGGNAQFFIQRDGIYGIGLDNADCWLEVIGNIHDNPELLETTAKPAAKNIAQSGLAPATENFELMEG